MPLDKESVRFQLLIGIALSFGTGLFAVGFTTLYFIQSSQLQLMGFEFSIIATLGANSTLLSNIEELRSSLEFLEFSGYLALIVGVSIILFGLLWGVRQLRRL